MILNVNEVELLKLLCWCKNAPAPSEWSIGIFNTQNISALEHFGLVFMSRNGKNIRPRLPAYCLLEKIGYSFKSDAAPQTRQRILDRRNIASKILLTFYSAGADVFKDTIDEIFRKTVYVPSFAARSASTGNPFGSTKFYGIYQTAGTLYLVFYADDAGVYFQKELTLFHSYIDRSHIQNTGLIFMGGSVTEIGDTVFHEPRPAEQPKKKYNTDSFGKVFSITSLPVHFVPVGQCGVRMLRYMAMEHYRERLAKMILRKSYRPPYDALPDTDAIHYQPPFFVDNQCDFVGNMEESVDNPEKYGEALPKIGKQVSAEPPERLFQNRQNGGSETAEMTVQEPTNPRPSIKELREKDLSETESQSVLQTDGDADANALRRLLVQSGINFLPEDHAEVMRQAIERLFYSQSLKIGDTVYPGAYIRQSLERLDYDILQAAVGKITGNTSRKVRNSSAYVVAVLFNSIMETRSDLLAAPYLNFLRQNRKGGG